MQVALLYYRSYTRAFLFLFFFRLLGTFDGSFDGWIFFPWLTVGGFGLVLPTVLFDQLGAKTVHELSWATASLYLPSGLRSSARRQLMLVVLAALLSQDIRRGALLATVVEPG